MQRQPAVLLSSHLLQSTSQCLGSRAHRDDSLFVSPDTALGQPERGSAHVRVSSLLHQGWDNKVRARSHGALGALSMTPPDFSRWAVG